MPEILAKKIILISLILGGSLAFACEPNRIYKNPKNHQPYVGSGCVYYGKGGGFITSGKYKGFIISDQILYGFELLSQGQKERAFYTWRDFAGKNSAAAAYNVAVMAHKGEGVQRDDFLAMDYLQIAMKDPSIFDTANIYAVKIIQSALISLGYTSIKADGFYGSRTESAINDLVAKAGNDTPKINSDYWHFYLVLNEYEKSRFLTEEQMLEALGVKNEPVPALNLTPSEHKSEISHIKAKDSEPLSNSKKRPTLGELHKKFEDFVKTEGHKFSGKLVDEYTIIESISYDRKLTMLTYHHGVNYDEKIVGSIDRNAGNLFLINQACSTYGKFMQEYDMKIRYLFTDLKSGGLVHSKIVKSKDCK